jgi:hypothetical protein
MVSLLSLPCNNTLKQHFWFYTLALIIYKIPRKKYRPKKTFSIMSVCNQGELSVFMGVSLVPRAGLSALASPRACHYGLKQMPSSLTQVTGQPSSQFVALLNCMLIRCLKKA